MGTEPVRPEPAREAAGSEVRELATSEELGECLAIQRQVWGGDDADLMGVTQLRACQLAGGLVAGAWRDGRMVGFSSSLPAFLPGFGPGLHSDMTGVLPDARGSGVGRALKWFQREWCLRRGLDWVQWTFDPLRSRNARFNLELLGARGVAYLPDAYGEMRDELNRGLPSDRVLVRWDLRDDTVARLADGGARPDEAVSGPSQRVEEFVVLDEDDRGLPRHRPLPSGHPLLAVAIPRLSEQLWADRNRLETWRLAVRAAMSTLFGGGYQATRFVSSRYLFRSPDAPTTMPPLHQLKP